MKIETENIPNNKDLYPEISDGVIKLKPFKIEDAEKHLSGDDESQIKWLSGGKSTLESTQNWIRKNLESWQTGGHVFNFAVWTDEGNLVGMVEANTDNSSIEGLEEGDANISYSLYPDARGKGYITRAVDLLLEFLRDKDIKRGVIRVHPENTNSLNVPLRCGFQEIGTIKDKDGNPLRIFVKQLIK